MACTPRTAPAGCAFILRRRRRRRGPMDAPAARGCRAASRRLLAPARAAGTDGGRRGRGRIHGRARRRGWPVWLPRRCEGRAALGAARRRGARAVLADRRSCWRSRHAPGCRVTRASDGLICMPASWCRRAIGRGSSGSAAMRCDRRWRHDRVPLTRDGQVIAREPSASVGGRDDASSASIRSNCWSAWRRSRRGRGSIWCCITACSAPTPPGATLVARESRRH